MSDDIFTKTLTKGLGDSVIVDGVIEVAIKRIEPETGEVTTEVTCRHVGPTTSVKFPNESLKFQDIELKFLGVKNNLAIIGAIAPDNVEIS